jgi:hypothetical protein
VPLKLISSLYRQTLWSTKFMYIIFKDQILTFSKEVHSLGLRLSQRWLRRVCLLGCEVVWSSFLTFRLLNWTSCFLLGRRQLRVSSTLKMGVVRFSEISLSYRTTQHHIPEEYSWNYISITKPNWLMLFREIIAVYCENYTEHINTPCGQNAETLYVRIQSVPHRKHITSPLQRPTG